MRCITVLAVSVCCTLMILVAVCVCLHTNVWAQTAVDGALTVARGARVEQQVGSGPFHIPSPVTILHRKGDKYSNIYE